MTIGSTATMATTGEVVAELRSRSEFVMVSHVKPDGDTLGAGLALGIALKKLGKRVYYFQPGSGSAKLCGFFPTPGSYRARCRPILLPTRSSCFAT